jgi:hypothetical protein
VLWSILTQPSYGEGQSIPAAAPSFRPEWREPYGAADKGLDDLVAHLWGLADKKKQNLPAREPGMSADPVEQAASGDALQDWRRRQIEGLNSRK